MEPNEENLSDAAREIAARKQPIHPEVIAWALQDINEAEIAVELEEIRRIGGLRFSDFEAELEQIVRA